MAPAVDEPRRPSNQITIPRAELEELVGALEFELNDPTLANCEYSNQMAIAAKFRTKYLEGK